MAIGNKAQLIENRKADDNEEIQNKSISNLPIILQEKIVCKTKEMNFSKGISKLWMKTIT